ncbi:phosducin-like protein [Saccostrea echinata]|uniref:phosducin-like protein n=1 Tax=Saccostrea echinata TaxID=191078 RepID=UPI002A83020B|nr:phosducin-like protein [Saccostrea echinata]
MALSPDDRILGEKVDNYCSSDEGEREDEEEEIVKPEPKTSSVPEPRLKDYSGFSTNTGPKGVINDWREYKRLENERREEKEREKQALAKKLQLTCRSHLDDEREKENDEKFLEELESFEDEFLKEYRQKRIEEMRLALQNIPKFGKLIEISSSNFVNEIDKEQPQVIIIIHLYEDDVEACEAMNGCLNCLAQEYPTVKFCKIRASDATLSLNFSKSGVPALLIYKGGELIGNFVRLSDELGEDFYATDLESFLHEHSFLPNPDINNKIIYDRITGEKRVPTAEDEDSGSDFDVD